MEMENIDDLVNKVKSLTKVNPNLKEALGQYDPETHQVFDPVKRPKKIINKPSGKKDPKTGEDILQTCLEEVVRIGLPLQKLIVKRRAAFMNTGKITLQANPQDPSEQKLLNMVNKCRKDNKLEYRSSELAKRMMSELHCAELWYSEPVEPGYWGQDGPQSKFKMKMRILSPSLGDNLYPVFDNDGDLIYFGRSYKTFDNAAATKKEIENFDIYNKEGFWHIEKGKNAIYTPYSYGKIPIIYYWQQKSEWNDIQPAIERLETVLSNLGDTNDYNGSPILLAIGKIKGFASKGERGKTFEVDSGGDLRYVNWDNAPQSVKLETDMLIDFIYTCTQTPNISFEKMQGLGGLSGVAFDRIFLDAHLAAQEKLNGIYGECLQRQINFLKSACASINTSLKSAQSMVISPKFSLFRIDNDSEIADLWMKLNGSKALVSQRTSIARAGFVEDIDQEMQQLEKETPQPVKEPGLIGSQKFSD